MDVVLFLHGWKSVPGGVKPSFLQQSGFSVINPALPDDDFDESVRIARSAVRLQSPQVIVGSSRGGAVAMSLGDLGIPLVLLCPAWRKYGRVLTVPMDTVILHSRADDVIPFDDSVELLRRCGLPESALWETGSDHRLADPDSLERMRSACSGAVRRPA